MAGHSHSHNIAKRKGVQDAKRSKDFTIAARLIIAAVKKSGVTDPTQNPSLRLALDKARAVNMPNQNIERAIRRGAGKSESGTQLEEVLYEGYGPYGVGIMVQARTDNKQRTASEIRHLFSRYGGALAGPGAAAYLFTSPDATEYIPAIPLTISPEEMEALMELIGVLESHDDVDGVWHNAQVSTQ